MPKSKQRRAGDSWLASVQWSRQSPKRLRQAAASNPTAFADLLADRLASRKDLVVASTTSPFLLGATTVINTSAAAEHVERLYECGRSANGSAAKRQVMRWPDHDKNGIAVTSPTETLELLVWCDALPRLAHELSAPHLLRVFQQIVSSLNGTDEAVFQAGETKPGQFEGTGSPTDSPELHAVLRAELLLTAACLFPELADSRKLRNRSAQIVSQTLTQLTDAKGIPAAGVLPLLPAILASLWRSATLARRAGIRPWSSGAQGRYEKLLRQAARFIRPDDRFAFTSRRLLDPAEKRRCATASDGQGSTSNSFSGTACPAEAVPAGRLKIEFRPVKQWHNSLLNQLAGRKHEPPAFHSERSKLAVLRSGWSAKADWLAVAWHQAVMELELLCAGKPALEGAWQIDLRVDGTRLHDAEPYELLCWVSDEDLDYLELRCGLTGGATLERHFLLARHDRFALLADSVMAPAGARVEVSSSLDLAPGIRLDADRTTRGGWLRREKKKVARLAPLWLPQYRVEGTPGAFEQDEGRLVMKACVPGRSVCMPLMLDWGKHGSHPAVEWRRLSVAENRRVVPSDRAAGFRFRVGDHQLLFYRSLGPHAVRSVLGHQTRYQLVLGRFDEDGNVEPLLEIL